MKRCPQCHRVETDEALKFCRVDGASLVSDSGAIGGELGTAKFASTPVSSEIKTNVLPHRTDAEVNRATAPTTGLPAAASSSTTSELKKTKRRGVVFGSFTKGGWQGFLHSQVTDLEQSKSNPYALAIAYVELGEKDKALSALEDVYNAHSNFVGYFKIDPQLNPLRDDPRFKALLKKSGFPE